MQFEHDHHQDTHHRVGEILRDLFEEPYLDKETGHFYTRYGSTVLEISVEPYGPEETMVEVTAYCVQGVRLDDELLAGLLELNHRVAFGAFSLVNNDIFFSHSVFGPSVDSKNLLNAIASVATVSDDYDDRIVEKYGGQTALGKIHDTGGRKKRSASAN